VADATTLGVRDLFEAGMALVVGVVLPWVFNKYKTRRADVDSKLTAHSELLETHRTKLAVLENDKANVAEVLRDIRETNQLTNEKLDAVILKLIS